jgi:vacuolar-type H+-ATPase subunit E/Vma4
MQHETKPDSGAESQTTEHSPGGRVETMDLLDEPAGSISPSAESDNQPDASSPHADDGAEPADAGTVPAFLHEIARQMQAAVDRERGRIAADAVNSLDAHVQKVRMRASIEAEELKRLAEEDVGHINEWSAAEAERLRRETENRIDARREDLERHLRQHEALVEREISGASEAVEEYQAELDRFVGRLAGEREPTEIAQLASQLPEPPRVEEIASAARAEAIAQLSRSEAGDDGAPASLGLVGVMDPSVISQPAAPDAPDAAPAQEAASAQDAAPAQEAGPAQTVEATPGDEPVEHDQHRRILGAQSNVELAVRLAVVVALVALVAAVVFLVVTGQVNVASSGGPPPGS